MNIVDVPGDGDCFFHTVILGLGLNTSPEVLRGLVADYILSNPEVTEEIIDEWRDFDVLKDDETLTVEEVASVIRETREWATGAIINITSIVLRISIQVFSNINGHMVSQTFPYSWLPQQDHLKTLQILSTGNHFQLITESQTKDGLVYTITGSLTVVFMIVFFFLAT